MHLGYGPKFTQQKHFYKLTALLSWFPKGTTCKIIIPRPYPTIIFHYHIIQNNTKL